jgi:hypothetical protein
LICCQSPPASSDSIHAERSRLAQILISLRSLFSSAASSRRLASARLAIKFNVKVLIHGRRGRSAHFVLKSAEVFNKAVLIETHLLFGVSSAAPQCAI